MLRVTTLYASSAIATASYYTLYLVGAPGEEPGVWCGDQAIGLGFSGGVAADDLRTVLEGRDPASGTPLGKPLVDRSLANGKVVRAVSGFDATFSAPKSVSVWWALTGDAGLLEAHDLAVRAALEHLERFGATTRVRVDLFAGFLALSVAAKASGWSNATSAIGDQEASPTGAIKTVAGSPGGTVMRWLLAIGMMLYAAWPPHCSRAGPTPRPWCTASGTS